MAGRRRVCSFKADESLVEALDRIAEAKRVTRSDVIRRALELYVKLESQRGGYRLARPYTLD